jgi:hypothetical protein
VFGGPVFGGKVDDTRDAFDADAETLGFLLSDAWEALASRDTASVAHIAARLLEAHGLPSELLGKGSPWARWKRT